MPESDDRTEAARAIHRARAHLAPVLNRIGTRYMQGLGDAQDDDLAGLCKSLVDGYAALSSLDERLTKLEEKANENRTVPVRPADYPGGVFGPGSAPG